MEINKQDIEKEREIIAELQHQLAEKDKKIEELRDLAVGFEENFAYTLNQKFQLEKENKNLRHQVCEDLRKWLKNTVTKSVIGKKFIFEKLDQIEQGESK